METNAERKPRIIEVMTLVIYLFAMPLELKSSILMGRGVKKSHKSAKKSPRGKRRISIAFQGPPKAASNCRILAFWSFCCRGVKKPRWASKGSPREELAKKIKTITFFLPSLAAPLKPNLSIWRGRGGQNQWARKCGPEVANVQNRRAAPGKVGSHWGHIRRSLLLAKGRYDGVMDPYMLETRNKTLGSSSLRV